MAGKTIVLDARHADGAWWIGKNGRVVASDPVCLKALKAALWHAPGPDIVSIGWSSPPDSSIPQETHSALLTAHEWRQITGAQ